MQKNAPFALYKGDTAGVVFVENVVFDDTSAKRYSLEQQKAEAESQRAEAERQRAEKVQAKRQRAEAAKLEVARSRSLLEQAGR